MCPRSQRAAHLEELVKQNGGMDCTSDFQDEKLTIEPICNTRRTSWASNLSPVSVEWGICFGNDGTPWICR
jgi:hypothetical protein